MFITYHQFLVTGKCVTISTVPFLPSCTYAAHQRNRNLVDLTILVSCRAKIYSVRPFFEVREKYRLKTQIFLACSSCNRANTQSGYAPHIAGTTGHPVQSLQHHGRNNSTSSPQARAWAAMALGTGWCLGVGGIPKQIPALLSSLWEGVLGVE